MHCVYDTRREDKGEDRGEGGREAGSEYGRERQQAVAGRVTVFCSGGTHEGRRKEREHVKKGGRDE